MALSPKAINQLIQSRSVTSSEFQSCLVARLAVNEYSVRTLNFMIRLPQHKVIIS